LQCQREDTFHLGLKRRSSVLTLIRSTSTHTAISQCNSMLLSTQKKTLLTIQHQNWIRNLQKSIQIGTPETHRLGTNLDLQSKVDPDGAHMRRCDTPTTPGLMVITRSSSLGSYTSPTDQH
jgi:hypothetical protein